MVQQLDTSYQELGILLKFSYISNMEDGVEISITKKPSTAVINDQIPNMEVWALLLQAQQPTVKESCLIIRKITSRTGRKFI